MPGSEPQGKLSVLPDVYKSEAEANQRNQAIGMQMYAHGHIKGDPAVATDIYRRRCSVGVNAKDLAMMAATLANAGRNPVTSKQVIRLDAAGNSIRAQNAIAEISNALGGSPYVTPPN